MAIAWQMPLRVLLDSLTSEDISELLYLDKHYGLIADPWRQTGLICATLGNCHRGKEQTAFSAEDFMPVMKRKANSRQLCNALLTFAKVHNAALASK